MKCWRGPLWFPFNFLLIQSTAACARYYDESYTMSIPPVQDPDAPSRKSPRRGHLDVHRQRPREVWLYSRPASRAGGRQRPRVRRLRS
jgi:hypothetical protein